MADNRYEITEYDPLKVTLAVDGRILTGFATDSIITMTRNEDNVVPQVSVKGEITYDENANDSGKITISLMSTSSSLSYLRSLCQARKRVNVSLSDANDADPIQVNESDCRILKVPDAPRNKASSTVTIDIFVPRLNIR